MIASIPKTFNRGPLVNRKRFNYLRIKLKTVLAEFFDLEEHEINSTSSLVELLDDSASTPEELASFLEDKYELPFTSTDVEECLKVSDLSDLLSDKRNAHDDEED